MEVSDYNANWPMIGLVWLLVWATITAVLIRVVSKRMLRNAKWREQQMLSKERRKDRLDRLVCEKILEGFTDLEISSTITHAESEAYQKRIARGAGLWRLMPENKDHPPRKHPSYVKEQIKFRLANGQYVLPANIPGPKPPKIKEKPKSKMLAGLVSKLKHRETQGA